LVCDSKKSYSFSKLQVKHLEDLSAEISRLLFWAFTKKSAAVAESSWEAFLARTERLAGAIGLESIELLRVELLSYPGLEAALGTTMAVQRCDQFVRLVQQAIPPHFPLTKLPGGDLIIAVDNMMSSFFQNKIRNLADHLSDKHHAFAIEILPHSARAARVRTLDLDAILRQPSLTTKAAATVSSGGKRA
jgi:hypothetical protein